MDRKVGGALVASLFLAGLSALVMWFLVFSLHVALGAPLDGFQGKFDPTLAGLVLCTDGMWRGRERSVQAGDGSWIATADAIWVGGHLGWADKTLQGGH